MNEIIQNSTFIVCSVLITQSYRIYCKKICPGLSSISASAKYTPLSFFLFITIGVCIPLGYVGRSSYLMIMASMLLFGIGTITGYNSKLWGKRWLQDFLHVILTNAAILLFIMGMIGMNLEFLKLFVENPSTTMKILSNIVVILFGIPCIIMFIFNKKVEDHTRKIEWLVIYMAQTNLFFTGVIVLIILLITK